ncbi:hypothetical protein FRC12_015566 [Ceratobasidium sp. 428]|nr:hypothetical protein FRC12_015566 [Ceratobasidium sp. 428]
MHHRLTGQFSLVHPDATDCVKRGACPEQAACFQCGEQVVIKREMRIHVGRHLLAMRSHNSKGNANILADIPCYGFCGRKGTCNTTVERQSRAGKSLKVVSNCPYRDTLTYATIPKSTKTSPCTNHLIECPHCPQNSRYIWSYGLYQHILITHRRQALLAASEEIKKYEPSDGEFAFMRVDRETGKIQLSDGKRRRGTAAAISAPAQDKKTQSYN